MGTKLLNALSFSNDAIISTTYSNDYIVRGYSFNIENVYPVTASSSINFLLIPDTTKNLIFLPINLYACYESVIISIYEDTDYTGGSSITPINLNRQSNNTLSSDISGGATGTDKGTLIKKRIIPATKKESGQSMEGSITILDSSKKYLIELTNIGTSDTNVGIESTFYEY